MLVIEWQQFLKNGISPETRQISMTVGIFDGIHRGHQALIERVISHNAKFVPAVVTFRQNHKTINGDILTFQQRIEKLENLGIQIIIVIDFTEEFKMKPGIEFLQILLNHGNIGFFTVGSDFRCGYRLDTDAEVIKKFFTSHNIPVEIVPQVMEGSQPISSSRIRSAIAQGDTTLAQMMLGHSV